MKKLLTVLLFAVVALTAVKPAYALETPYLNATNMGGGNVKLWWSQVSDATYQVLYGPKNNPWAHGVVLGNGTSYTVGSLFANTSYVFTVKAVKGNEVSGMSNQVTVWVGGNARAPLPAQPVVATTTYTSPAATTMPVQQLGVGTFHLRAMSGQALGTVALLWDEPVESGNYNIVYTDDPMVEKWGVLNLSRDQRMYVVGGLVSGRTYWFWMATTTGRRTAWVSAVAR